MTAALELDDVRLTYPDGDRTLVALDGVSLQVPRGRMVAVVGPSGSGKSSLLAVAGLLIQPDAGRVLISGGDQSALSREDRARSRRERIGFVFQQSNLIASLTALDQLLAVAHLGAGIDEAARARAGAWWSSCSHGSPASEALPP